MSTSVSFNGTSYTVPAIADASWGTNVSNYLIAIASGCLQKTGGSFTLSAADVNFGATYGLKAVYFKSVTANIASAGVVQLAKTDVMSWRNNANGADLSLGINGSDALIFNSIAIADASSTMTFTNKLFSDSTCKFANVSDTTKLLKFSLGGATAGKTMTFISSHTNDRSLTFPDATDTLVGLATTDTFSGVKTFGDGKLALSGSSSGTMTVKAPAAASTYVATFFAATDTVMGLTFQQTATNKLFSDSTVKFANVSDPTKLLLFSLGGATTGKVMTFVSSHTNDRSITFPDATDTLVGLATTDTFSGVKTFGDGKLALNGSSSGTMTIKAPAAASTYVATFFAATDTVMGLTFQQTATNKLLSDSTVKFANVSDTTKVALFSLGGATAGKALTLISSHTNDRSITFPDATDTLMGKATTDTMTNKTATAMNITGGSYVNYLVQAAARYNDSSTNYVAVKAPSSVTTYTILWPTAQGAASTVLTNDGSGNLSWGSALTTALNQYNTFIGDSTNTAVATNTNLIGDIFASTLSQSYTVTNAAPGVFTVTTSPSTGSTAYVTVTQNGFTANTRYYVTKIDGTTFKLATTFANALAGTNITSSGTTAGTIVSGGLQLATTGLLAAGVIAGAAGSASAPEFTFSGDANTGIYSIGADDIGIATGGTLRFDISTSAITSTLQHLNADGSNSTPAYSFSSDTDCGMYRIGTNNIGWAVNGTARGQISADGSWQIGTLTTTALNVDHSCSGRWNMKTPSANGRMDWTSDATANGIEYIRFNDNAGKTGDITINGVAHTTAFNTSSDARLKTAIADFNALAMIKKMHPAEYERISQPGVKEYGFIAQELYEVLPQAVTRGDLIPLREGETPEKDQMWSVDYGKVTGVLCKALQEAIARIEILEKKLGV